MRNMLEPGVQKKAQQIGMLKLKSNNKFKYC